MLWGLQACSHSTSLKFVQLSDIHFLENGQNTTFKMTGASSQLLDDAVEQINEEQEIDFVMLTGDIIDKPFEKELRAFLSHIENLKYPWYFAFGNHDRCVGGYLTTSVYMDMVKKSNKNYNFNKPYYAFTPKKGYRVIVLDNIITDKVTTQGYLDEEQVLWLKKELEKSKRDTVLIFMNVPLIEPFTSPNHRLKNAVQVMSIIESYKNPIGVFQGHYHATRVVQHDNVLYVNSPALVSYPNAFRIINVTNHKDKTVFELKWVETREKAIQKTAKLLVVASNIFAGEEKDRQGVYEIKKVKE
jgi:3',5'-cyclic AMP phosphodiesterase CpdA